MKRFAKALSALGAIWIIFSFLACNAISRSHLMQGGLADHIFLPAKTMSYDDQLIWLSRLFGECFFMGFLGAAFLIIGGIMYFVSKLIRKIGPRAAQA